MAIIAGFNNASCQRLKHTFEAVDKDLTKVHYFIYNIIKLILNFNFLKK